MIARRFRGIAAQRAVATRSGVNRANFYWPEQPTQTGRRHTQRGLREERVEAAAGQGCACVETGKVRNETENRPIANNIGGGWATVFA